MGGGKRTPRNDAKNIRLLECEQDSLNGQSRRKLMRRRAPGFKEIYNKEEEEKMIRLNRKGEGIREPWGNGTKASDFNRMPEEREGPPGPPRGLGWKG